MWQRFLPITSDMIRKGRLTQGQRKVYHFAHIMQPELHKELRKRKRAKKPLRQKFQEKKNTIKR